MPSKKMWELMNEHLKSLEVPVQLDPMYRVWGNTRPRGSLHSHMPTGEAMKGLREMLRQLDAGVPLDEVDPPEQFVGLTTIDPDSGNLSEPTWPGYRRQPDEGAVLLWEVPEGHEATLYGAFITDAKGRVLEIHRFGEPTYVLDKGGHAAIQRKWGGTTTTVSGPQGLREGGNHEGQDAG